MKKTLQEKASLLLFAVFLALIIYSCKKDLSTTVEPGKELSETSGEAIIRAREAFIKQSADNLVQHTGKSFLSDSLLNYRTVLWSDAYTKISGDTVAVFIPIKIPATLTIDEGSLAGTCLNDNLFLRMIDNGDGFKPRLTEMVSMIPDDSNGWNIRKKFSGLLFLENWYSPSSSFIQVSQGQKVAPVKKVMSDGGMSTQGYPECQTVSVTQCTGGHPDYMNCEVVTTTTCMGGGDTGGGGGTGGGGEGGQPPVGGGPGGGGTESALDFYYSGEGESDFDDNTQSTAPRQSIPPKITLKNGKVVNVIFGSTASDLKSANQLVSSKLVTALIDALDKASVSVTISSIYIKATTNGSHTPVVSNHYKGIAIDISRINGQFITNLGSGPLVTALQNAFESVPGRRENFGPAFKHKLGQPWTIGGHQDHIHFSINGD